MKINAPFFVFCLLTLAPILTVHAKAPQYQHNIHAIGQLADVHFVELDSEGKPFNEEKGSLFYTGAGIYWEFDSGLFTEMEFKSAEDTITYRGLSQFGRFTESKTEYFIRDAYILLGRNFGPTGAYIGLGNRYRERNILATGNVAGLYEETDVIYGSFGLRALLFANRPFQIRINGQISTDTEANLTAASESYDRTTIELGKHLEVAASVEFLFSLFSGFTLSLIPAYEYIHISESDSYKVYVNGTYRYDGYHPETEYETLSLSAKLSWYF